MLDIIRNHQERVALQPIDHHHIEAMTSHLGSAEVLDRMLFKPQPFSIGDAQSFVLRAKAANPLDMRVNAIINKETDEFLGLISISVKDNHIIPSFGYWIGEKHWSQGFATEAVGVLIRDILPDFRFAMLRAGCELDNIASQRVLEKNGFRPQETAPLSFDNGRETIVRWYQLNLEPYHGFAPINENQLETRAIYA
ncbi:GNAT family N-acetyltransferase [Lentilitoribacter sp. EG35]|jgi:RimJ/RimL family protein N-acetyltransferase|uniref:GNAT family N-acetyltransferase n=1 Tax=Lentilitoribacter sp. EG35 TaxID=3234192 RepID=UPI00345FB69B